jgi:flagellar M-ring protein FliF
MRRTLEQLLAIYNSLAPSQRITFAAIAVLIPLGFLFFAWNGSSSSMIPLSYGKVFSLDELRNAEQALKEAGLSKFRSEGRQILAPAAEVEKYNAALLQAGSLPSHWAEELEKKLENTNPFMTSSETLRQTRDAILGKHLRQMILGSADFEDAEVIWTPPSTTRPHFGTAPRTKATVVVKPRAGHDLTLRQVQALRDAVTFAIPDLKAADVTIYDQRKGESFTPDSENDPLGSKQLVLLRESAQLYETRIHDALSHISRDIVVAVNVEIDPLQRSVTSSQKWDLKKSIEQQQTEQKRTERYRQAPVQAEPGTRSNVPRALSTSPGNTQDRTMQEESTSTTRNPGGEQTYTEMIPALPKVVTVSVLIPEDYYKKAFEAQQKEAGANRTAAKTMKDIKDETEKAVRDIVAGAIPYDPNNPNPRTITVNSFVPVREEIAEIKPSTLDSVTSVLSQWGSAVGIGLFALWALWMLRATSPKKQSSAPEASIVVEPKPQQPQPSAAAVETALQPQPTEPTAPTLTDRDLVQDLVRENPEMAVAIIGKWLQSSS